MISTNEHNAQHMMEQSGSLMCDGELDTELCGEGNETDNEEYNSYNKSTPSVPTTPISTIAASFM